tara:strand:- start:14118 stop:14594 length:477 start_codon:yes stop_codon:yes gene_type:complete
MTMASAVAQLNIGQLLHPIDHPETAGFADNTARVNAVAERAAGFVWRCQDEGSTLAAEGIDLYDGDPCALATLSAWASPADLDNFVHQTVHGAFLKRRQSWFRKQDHKTYVIWPIATGHIPSFREGLGRLAALEADGPTDAAYDFNYMRHKLRAEASK